MPWLPKRFNLLSSEEIRLLTEVGFLAAGRGDVMRAERIFGALQRLRPQRAFAPIGLSVAYMNAGRHDEAAGILAHAAAQVEPAEQAELDAFRGLALQLAGRSSESVRALKSAGENHLAHTMLGLCTSESAETICKGSS